MMRNVVALYVDVERGPYAELIGAENCWGVDRDAKLYVGPGPAIAHPPCGPWGRLAHLCTKQDPECAVRAVEQVRAFGGVLERPRDSRLWAECGLPVPSSLPYLFRPDEFTIEVDQCCWGHPCAKKTWLFFAGVSPADLPPIPPWRQPTHVIDTNSKHKAGSTSTPRGGGLPHLPKSRRHITPPTFAAWLVSAARSAG